MIVGYIDKHDAVSCGECWLPQAEAGARPSQVLDSEEPGNDCNLWLVDACSCCGKHVKYKMATVLE